MSLIECNCDGDGSENGNCNDAGKCSCKPGFDGNKCDKCGYGYEDFPSCEGISIQCTFIWFTIPLLESLVTFTIFHI